MRGGSDTPDTRGGRTHPPKHAYNVYYFCQYLF